MIGLTMKYEKYEEQLKTMEQPVKASDIPDIQIDLPAMVSYAKKKGKTVPDLTEEEKKLFIQEPSQFFKSVAVG